MPVYAQYATRLRSTAQAGAIRETIRGVRDEHALATDGDALEFILFRLPRQARLLRAAKQVALRLDRVLPGLFSMPAPGRTLTKREIVALEECLELLREGIHASTSVKSSAKNARQYRERQRPVERGREVVQALEGGERGAGTGEVARL